MFCSFGIAFKMSSASLKVGQTWQESHGVCRHVCARSGCWKIRAPVGNA